jgi:phage gp36-like protein
MLYTSPEQVKKIMRKLPSSVTDEDIQFHIDKAEAYVNGKLGGVFITPFNPIPRLIESITTDLAIFFLAESLYSSNQPNLDQYQEERYERAMRTLNEIATGELILTTVDGIVVKPRDLDAGGYATTNDQQVFSYEDPEW